MILIRFQKFFNPHSITTDGKNLYIADSGNHSIRKIEISSGVVTTIAGIAGYFGSTDGTVTSAKFSTPISITNDSKNLYVSEWGNHTIRKIQ